MIIVDYVNLISSKQELKIDLKVELTSYIKSLNVKVHIPKCNPVDGCREENCTRH